MAQRAEPLDDDLRSNELTSAPVMDVEVATESLQIGPRDGSEMDSASRAQQSMYSLAVGIQKARFWGECQMHRLKRARTEEPLKLLAIIAGSAFVVGTLLRVWRSNNEPR